jgi:subtilisin family serine protease
MSNRLLKFAIIQAMVLALVVGGVRYLSGEGTEADAAATLASVIVEFKDEPGAVYKARAAREGRAVSDEQLQAYRDGLRAAQDNFLATLTGRGVAFQVESVDIPDYQGNVAANAPYRFTLVLNAVALKVPATSVAAIKAMPQVKRVHPNKTLRVQLEKSVEYVNAPASYGQVKELTADDDHREGFEGQGINVAVLDTGIDWRHEMFGGDPTPPRLGVAPPVAGLNTNKKVIYYLSFTGGLLDDYGHGSHAASDAAGYRGFAPGADKLPGTLDDKAIHGVAPQARLMGYKVCTAVGNCVETSTILAIEDAVSPLTLTLQPKPVAHVINLSLGGEGGPDDASAVAASNAALLGTTVVASAGNSGPGENTVGSPAAGRHVIAVGANNEPAGGSNTIDVIGGRSGIIANQMEGSAGVPADVVQNYVNCGLAETPDAMPNSVSGRIALIARGSTVNTPDASPVAAGTGLFATKAAWAVAKGAIAVVFYNNIDGELTAATARASTVPIVGISKANGEYLISLLSSSAVGTVSTHKIRINNELLFTPQMADFSSRGPVQGLGQVKPDVTAPGVAILGATVRVGSADTNTGTMFDPTGYIHANGTSFSGPHVAGAAALVKQAHLDYSPDMIRAALINTATNLRSSSGAAKPDGASSDSIIEQGGGLIDVTAAIKAKALMGVAGDGIDTPGILASHSFGELPIINNRVANTRSVTVTIRDTSGQGGTYNLSVANNRFFETDGVKAFVSPASVQVPAGGSATFTASVTLDGNTVRDTSAPMQLQWYVVANRADGNERLRMPMYLKATATVPSDSIGSSTTETFTGTVLAADAGAQRDTGVYVASGVTYEERSFNVSDSALKIEATLEFEDTTGQGIPDLDLVLFDPDGNEIGSSGNSGGPEHLSVNVNRGGQYLYRVIGWANGPTDFTLTSTQSLGGAPPVVQALASDFVEADGRRLDYDGNYTVSWQPQGNVLKYEIEESTDGTNYTVVRELDGNATSADFTGVANGTRSYRVRSITQGRVGFYVTPPSNVESITVERRTAADVTSLIQTAIVDGTLSFAGGVTQYDQTLKNKSTGTTIFPPLRFTITAIQSGSGNVRVANADNNGEGSTQSPASFDYVSGFGSDFAPGETSGARRLRFSNPNAEMFQFTAVVTAYLPGASSGTTSSGGDTIQSGGGGGGTTTQQGVLGISTTNTVQSVLKFTVNPLTRTVKLVQ